MDRYAVISKVRLGEQTQGRIPDTQLASGTATAGKVPVADGSGSQVWTTPSGGGGGGGSGASDLEHDHVHDRFIAAGATPETFTLAADPLFGEVQVFIQGVLADPDDVALSGNVVSVDTTAADVVVIFYATEGDVFKRINVSVDFTDIPNDADSMTLYSPAAGEIVYIVVRPDTLVPFTGGGLSSFSDYVALGRNASSIDYQATLPCAGASVADAYGQPVAGRQYAASNTPIAGDYCPDTTPVEAVAVYNGDGPATAGHADLVLLVVKVG